jgi:hypothetical protein
MQRNLFALLQAESEGITWKSYMCNLPHGVLKFALNASTNLKRWGKHASVNCHLCGNIVKQMLFHVLVNCNHTMDQGRMTWRHDSILKHIAGCLKSTFESLHDVEVYCDLEGLQAPGSGSIPASVMMQTQRPDLVILDRSVHGRHRISLVELTRPWDTDADKVRDHKISRYAGLKEELSNQGWDCCLYTIKVGARGHISKVLKDCLWSLFRSWILPGHRSAVAQMIKYASWISLVCSFSIFQARNNPVWITPRLVSHHIKGVPADK